MLFKETIWLQRETLPDKTAARVEPILTPANTYHALYLFSSGLGLCPGSLGYFTGRVGLTSSDKRSYVSSNVWFM